MILTINYDDGSFVNGHTVVDSVNNNLIDGKLLHYSMTNDTCKFMILSN